MLLLFLKILLFLSFNNMKNPHFFSSMLKRWNGGEEGISF